MKLKPDLNVILNSEMFYLYEKHGNVIIVLGENSYEVDFEWVDWLLRIPLSFNEDIIQRVTSTLYNRKQLGVFTESGDMFLEEIPI
jgi:hypothetical protein